MYWPFWDPRRFLSFRSTKTRNAVVAETAAPVVFFRQLHISASSQIVTRLRNSMIKSVLDTKAPLCLSEEHKANCAAYFVFIQMLNCACNDSLRDVSLIYHALGPTEKTYIDLSGVNSEQQRGRWGLRWHVFSEQRGDLERQWETLVIGLSAKSRRGWIREGLCWTRV